MGTYEVELKAKATELLRNYLVSWQRGDEKGENSPIPPTQTFLKNERKRWL
jgi:hypothetical protein